MWCSPSRPCRCQHISQKSKESAQTLVQTKTLRHQVYFTGGETKWSVIAVFGVTMVDNWQKRRSDSFHSHITFLFLGCIYFEEYKKLENVRKAFFPYSTQETINPTLTLLKSKCRLLFHPPFSSLFCVLSLSLHPPPVSLWGHAFNWWWIVMSIWGKYVSVHV